MLKTNEVPRIRFVIWSVTLVIFSTAILLLLYVIEQELVAGVIEIGTANRSVIQAKEMIKNQSN